MSTARPHLLLLLAGSVAVNLALVAALVVGQSEVERNDPAAALGKAGRPAPAAAPAGSDSTSWEKLQGSSPADLAARLRDSGFPPRIQRAILAAHLREANAARLKGLATERAETSFWLNSTPNPEASAASRRIYRDIDKTVRDLLGDEDSTAASAYDSVRLDYLSAAKAADVRAIIREFNERRSDLFASVGGSISSSSESGRRLEALEQEQNAAIARALTAEEFTDYELRNSRTAQSLRYTLSAFDPTEQEFRSIYALQAAFDQRFGRFTGITAPDEMRARSEAQQQLTAQIKAALGPARGEDYERAQNYDYRQAAQLVARLELPATTLNSLWEIQRSFEQRRNDAYRAGADASTRTATLAALQQEARAAVAPVIGQRNVDTYLQYGGRWIQSLVPRPAPTPPAAPAAATKK